MKIDQFPLFGSRSSTLNSFTPDRSSHVACEGKRLSPHESALSPLLIPDLDLLRNESSEPLRPALGSTACKCTVGGNGRGVIHSFYCHKFTRVKLVFCKQDAR